MTKTSSQHEAFSSRTQQKVFFSKTQELQTNINESDDDENDINAIIKDDLTTNVCCQY
jgi:hypothetical protein